MTTPDRQQHVFISYARTQGLHLAAPLWEALSRAGYDAYMCLNEAADPVDLNQVAARPHFVIVLPGNLAAMPPARDSALAQELAHAVALGRNIIPLSVGQDVGDADVRALPAPFHTLAAHTMVTTPSRDARAAVPALMARLGAPARHVALAEVSDAETEVVRRRVRALVEFTSQATVRLPSEKLFFRAMVMMRKGDLDSALIDFNAALQENPGNESAHLWRGLIYQQRDHEQAALADFEAALRLSPRLVEAHLARARALFTLGDVHGALDGFERARETIASDMSSKARLAEALAGLAVAYIALSQPSHALALWADAAALLPELREPSWSGMPFGWRGALLDAAHTLVSALHTRPYPPTQARRS